MGVLAFVIVIAGPMLLLLYGRSQNKNNENDSTEIQSNFHSSNYWLPYGKEVLVINLWKEEVFRFLLQFAKGRLVDRIIFSHFPERGV